MMGTFGFTWQAAVFFAAAFILMIFELIHRKGIFVCFAAGAVFAGGAGLFHMPFFVDLFVFIVMSGVFLCVIRPLMLFIVGRNKDI